MKRLLWAMIIIAMMAAMLIGCTPAGTPGETTDSGDSGETGDIDTTDAGDTTSGDDSEAPSGTLQSMIDPTDEYVVVCCIDSIEYWNAHRYGWQKAGELYGVNTSWQGITNDDITEMATLFDTVAAKEPDGIVVLGWDEGLAPSIDRAVDAGIPVVTFSGDVVTSERDTWVGSIQHDLGYTGGKKYAESVGGSAKLLF